MCLIRNPSIMEALSDDARTYGIKTLAPKLNKESSTLYAELNPWGDQGKGKLSLDDAIEIMRITQKFKTLDLIASALGFRLVPVDVVPDKPTVAEELADDTQKLGSWAAACMSEASTATDIELAAAALHKDIDETKSIKLAEIGQKKSLRQ